MLSRSVGDIKGIYYLRYWLMKLIRRDLENATIPSPFWNQVYSNPQEKFEFFLYLVQNMFVLVTLSRNIVVCKKNYSQVENVFYNFSLQFLNIVIR